MIEDAFSSGLYWLKKNYTLLIFNFQNHGFLTLLGHIFPIHTKLYAPQDVYGHIYCLLLEAVRDYSVKR